MAKYLVSSFYLQALIYFMAIIIRVHSAITRNYYFLCLEYTCQKQAQINIIQTISQFTFRKYQKFNSYPFFKNKNFISVYFLLQYHCVFTFLWL